jgi:heat shock protein HtpX
VYSAIAANKRNTVFIMVIFLIIIGGLAWLASYTYNNISLLFLIVIGAILYVVIQYFAAGSQALLFTGAIQIERAQNPRLWNMVENISITTGMPMPKVYIINDPAPNAFATGRDPKHASIAVTSGLLDIMDDAELEGVLAHEMGHIQNFDIRVSMIVFGLVVAVGIIADILLRAPGVAGPPVRTGVQGRARGPAGISPLLVFRVRRPSAAGEAVGDDLRRPRRDRALCENLPDLHAVCAGAGGRARTDDGP